MKLDLTKIDFKKLDFNDIKMIRWMALAFFVVVLVLDLFLYAGVFHNISEARIQRDKVADAVGFFKGIITKKDNLTKAQVIPQGNVDALSDAIQKMADNNKITVNIGTSLLTDKLNNDKDFYAQKDFTIDALGPFKDLGVFLNDLRGMRDAVLDIRKIRIFSDRINNTNVHAQITVMVLTTKDEENQ